MPASSKKSSLWIQLLFNRTALLLLLSAIMILLVSWLLINIVIYIILSVIIAYILETPTNYLSQLQFLGIKMPRSLAILLSFTVLFAITYLLFNLFFPILIEQLNLITSQNLTDYLKKLSYPIDYLEKVLIDAKIIQAERGFLMKGIEATIFNVGSKIEASTFVNKLVSFTGSFFVGLLAILFITFFLLYEKDAIRKRLISMIPNQYFEVSISALSKTEKLLSNYLFGLMVQITGIFILTLSGLLMVGVKYAVTISLVAAIANLIPFLGPLMSSIFGLFVGISAHPDPVHAENFWIFPAKMLLVFIVVHLIDNVVFQPLIYSKSVKAHPLIIFLVIFIGGVLAGPLGMICAIPVMTVIKVTVSEFYKGFLQYKAFRSD